MNKKVDELINIFEKIENYNKAVNSYLLLAKSNYDMMQNWIKEAKSILMPIAFELDTELAHKFVDKYANSELKKQKAVTVLLSEIDKIMDRNKNKELLDDDNKKFNENGSKDNGKKK